MPGSTSHTPAATWHAGPFDLPNDGGDPYQFSSIMKDAGASKGLIAKLLDRSQWLRGVYDALATGVTALDGTVTTHTASLASLVAGTLAVAGVKLTSQSITRLFLAWRDGNVGSVMGWEADSGSGRARQIATAADLWFALDLPHGATLTGISIRVNPSDAHGGAPTQRPRFEVYKVSSTGAATLIASELDPNVVLATYEAAHSISATGLSETIDRSAYTYVAVLRGEDGTNYADNLIAGPVSATFTTTALDKGAA